MRRIVEFKTDAGLIRAEVDEANAAGGERLADNAAGVTARATETLESALDSLRPGVDAAMAMLHSLAKRPSEFELEFGIKLDAAAGALFAKVGAEASFTITLKWGA